MTAPLARYPLHAFFTTSTLDTVTADKTHRAHAVIELVNSVQKSSVLAHLPTGVFTANAACLVLAVMAFSLTRAVATMAGNGLARAATATIRRKLVSVPRAHFTLRATHHPAPARARALGETLDSPIGPELQTKTTRPT